jgi:hypothetical protein
MGTNDQKTLQLWDTLRGQALDYYQTLHDARSAVRELSHVEGSAVSYQDVFEGLQDEHDILKCSFEKMIVHSRTIPIPGGLGYPPHMLSVEVQEVADHVFGPNVIG